MKTMVSNNEYLEIKYALINAFLLKAPDNIVDISYSVENDTIIIQVVLLEGTDLKQSIYERVENSLKNHEVIIKKVFISKEKFNENKGLWVPRYYNWLTYVLLSKAEVL
jgi:hypothetical protein